MLRFLRVFQHKIGVKSGAKQSKNLFVVTKNQSKDYSKNLCKTCAKVVQTNQNFFTKQNVKTMQKTYAKQAKNAKRKVEKFLDLPFVVLIIIQRLVDLEVGASLLPNLLLLVQLLVRSLLRTLLQKQELVLLEPS